MSSKSEMGKKRRGRFSLPALGKKTAEKDKVADSNFALGSGAVDDPNDPFSQAFKIEDEIGHIPSEKEMRKSKRGKSNIALGAKYGGRRKIFAILAAAMIATLLAIPLLWMQINSKMSKSEAKQIVETAVADSTAKTFPVGPAGMWMESFVRIYGTWDYKTPGARAADLSPYLAPGMDAQAGWNGKGTQRLIYSAVSNQPEIIDRQRAIFDVSYQIQDGTWRCAKVPVFAYKPTDSKQGPVNQWGFAVTANPTPMPCALRVSVPDFAGNKFPDQDQNAAETLRTSFFPGFFTAWIASDADTLRQFMAPDVKTFGLGGAYQSNASVDKVVLPIGAGEKAAAPNTVYTAYVSVILTDFTGSQLKATYKVPVASTGSQWQVMGEPEAIIQELQGLTEGLPESQGKTTDGSNNQQNNEYAEPDQAQPAQRADQTPTVPAPSASSSAPASPAASPSASKTP